MINAPPEGTSNEQANSPGASTRGTLSALPSSIDAQEKNLGRILDAIRGVDAKASTVLAGAVALLAVLAAVAPSPSTITGAEILWLAIGSLLPVGSVVLSGLVTYPRLKGPRGSLLYFGSIAKLSARGYADAVRGRTPELYLDDLSGQCHRNSEIAASKYWYAQAAFFSLIVGVGPWLITFYVLAKG